LSLTKTIADRENIMRELKWVASNGGIKTYESLGELYDMYFDSETECQAAIDSQPKWDPDWGVEPEIEAIQEMVEIEDEND
jgi:hypothetical protein